MYDPFWVHHAAQQLQTDPQFSKWNASAGWWLQRRVGTLKLAGCRADGTSAEP